MSAETADLTKVDSAVSGLSSSPTEEKKIGHRRASSSAAGVYNINDLGMSMALHADLALPSIQHHSIADASYREGRKGTPNSKGDSEIELVRDLTLNYLVLYWRQWRTVQPNPQSSGPSACHRS